MILERPAERLGRFARFSLGMALVASLGGSLALGDDNAADPQTVSAKKSEKSDAAKKEYFVTGRLTDAETGKPIVGASVNVLIISERTVYTDDEDLIRTDVTDLDGRYRIAVPVGDGRVWDIEWPAGYWSESANYINRFQTTPENSIAHFNARAKRGIPLHVQLVTDDPDLSLDNVLVEIVQMRPMSGGAIIIPNTTARTDSDGLAHTTIPPDGWKYQISYKRHDPLVWVGDVIKMSWNRGLRFDQVYESHKKDPSSTELGDRQGRSLRVSKGTLTTPRDGRVVLTLEVSAYQLPVRKIIGRVVDRNGDPLGGVHVGTWQYGFPGGGGNFLAGVHTTTSSDGSFTIKAGVHHETVGRKHRLRLMLNKRGYASHDTEPRPLKKGDKPLDLGDITLLPGHTIKVRVLGVDGKPVAGATVEPTGSLAARQLITRTNETGVAVINGLPPGEQSISARWGKLKTSVDVLITDAVDAEVEIRLERQQEIKHDRE